MDPAKGREHAAASPARHQASIFRHGIAEVAKASGSGPGAEVIEGLVLSALAGSGRSHLSQRCRGTPYRCWRSPIDFGKNGVEAPKAAEAGAHRDLPHRKSGFVEQPFCHLHAGRLTDLHWACSQVPSKEAIEMSCSDTETLRQRFDATLVQGTAGDETKSPLHSCP